jgi:hypothetical protein
LRAKRRGDPLGFRSGHADVLLGDDLYGDAVLPLLMTQLAQVLAHRPEARGRNRA